MLKCSALTSELRGIVYITDSAHTCVLMNCFTIMFEALVPETGAGDVVSDRFVSYRIYPSVVTDRLLQGRPIFYHTQDHDRFGRPFLIEFRTFLVSP